MKHTSLTTMLAALIAMVLLAPSAASARPLADHSAEFKEMQAAIDELAQKSGDEFEIMYINLIIPHHEGAIEMAEMVVNDAPHQEVRDAAAQIIEDQQKEINDLTNWLRTWYGQDVDPDERMMMDMSMMDMSMDATMHEKHFLAMMREHHQTAIEMGELVLQKATHEELKNQAQMMIDSQREEQEQFGTWLQQWYGITAPSPTGDMQDGMDAVMDMPMTMPGTGAEQWTGWVALVSALALFGGGYMVRRKVVT